MIISCQQCESRIQFDDAKLPTRPFTVRCPKCQHIINALPPAPEPVGSAVAAGGSDVPASARRPRPEGQSSAAPVYKLDAAAGGETQSRNHAESAPVFDAVATPGATGTDATLERLLSALLQRAGGDASAQGESSKGVARRWGPRRALVCVAPVLRERIARALALSRHEVYVAEDAGQSVERMREDRIDVIVLDDEFDAATQGAAHVTQAINSLRPAERRRLFFVQLTPSARTGDAHAAFLANVNLIVNSSEFTELPAALERALRAQNELYREFNKATNAAEL